MTEAARRREDGRSWRQIEEAGAWCMAAATCVGRGARPDIFDHRYSVAECGGTQPKRLKSVEYILLGTLV